MCTITNSLSFQQPLVSVLVPTYNEEKYIASCLETLLEQDYPKERLEIFVIDGNSVDNTKKIANSFNNYFSSFYLLNNPNKIVPFALNIGIKEAKGDVIIRIDAHSRYPKNYISSLVKKLYELNADNVGGVWNTIPGDSSTKALSIAIAASHPFGIGNSLHKIGTDTIIETDTVPYGCYRKEVFNRIGLFDEDLVRNQDDEFNGRLIKNGGKIYIIPDVVIDYYARTTYEKSAKMFYQYGLFKPLVNKKLGYPATIRQFFPLVFLLGLILGLGLSFVSSVLFAIYITVILFYLALSIAFSLISSVKNRRMLLILYLPYVFFIIHISYGFGYLIGLVKFVLLNANSLSVKSSR